MQPRAATVAFEYEATGTLGGIRFAVGTQERLAPVSFHVYVRDCKWLIRAKPSDEPRELEMSFDGEHLYSYGVRLDAAPGTDAWSGTVGPERVPFFGPVPLPPIVWLALAGSCYLDKANGLLVPPYSTDVLRTQLVVHVVRRLLPPRLPETIVFRDDGYDRGGGEPRKRRPPYDKGFTNAIFLATSFTNLGGCELPLAFSLHVFRPKPGGRSADELEMKFEYEGHISTVAPTCSLTRFIPKVAGASRGLVKDLRFALPDALVPRPFMYPASNWLTVAEAKQIPRFAEYLRTQPALKDVLPIGVHRGPARTESSPARRRVTAVAICSFAVVSAVLILVLLKQRAKRKH